MSAGSPKKSPNWTGLNARMCIERRAAAGQLRAGRWVERYARCHDRKRKHTAAG